MCILSYIYGSHSLELGEDIELFYVVQDFCLVTVEFGSLRTRVQTRFRPSDASQYMVVAQTPHPSSQVLNETIPTRNHPETPLHFPIGTEKAFSD